MADRFNMSDVMISYSRRDKPFVQQLEQALREDGLEIWVDWEDIPPTADWWQEIQAGIEAAHTFIFIISPASVNSSICTREIDHAMQHHKRLIPVLYKELSADDQAKMHPALSTHNWVYFREADHFRRAFLTLRSALETDLEHKKLHTRLLVRAREWDERGHSWSLLLRGDDLRQAENWLTRAIAGQTPQPTDKQIDYIRASTRASRRLTQRLIGSAVTALLLIVVGMVFALSQSEYAKVETNRALLAAQERSTQEWLANAGLAQAATAQKVAEDSANAAATAQAQVLFAQTQEQAALQNAGNSQTQAAIAQDSALTATVLQGDANKLAATAQQEQAAAEQSAGRSEQQAQQAEQQAQQAEQQAEQAEQAAAATATAAPMLSDNMVSTANAIGTRVRELEQALDRAATQVQATLAPINATGTRFIEDIAPTLNSATTQIAAEQTRQAQMQGTATSISGTVAFLQPTRDQAFAEVTQAAATAQVMKNNDRDEAMFMQALATATAQYIKDRACEVARAASQSCP